MEAIKAAALRTADGCVITAINHALCVSILQARGIVDWTQSIEEGFITTAGRFVGRVEALQIAVAALQAKPIPDGYLCSEDVQHAREAGAI